MTRSRSVNKTFIYKRVEFDYLSPKLGTKTLKDMLNLALAKKNKPLERSEKINENDEMRRVIGHYKSDGAYLCGQVMLYEKGMEILFLVGSDDETSFDVESACLSDATEDGKKREVLQGALYFVVFENHMAVLQSQSVTVKSLEQHLNWLLKECSEDLDKNINIILNNEPKESAIAAVSEGNFKSVKIGAPLAYPEQHQTSLDISTNQDSEAEHKKLAAGIEWLKSILPDKAWSDKLNLPEDVSNLEVTVEVKYNRTASIEGRKWLDDFARATRHYDPEDTVIKTDKGRTITGSELRLMDRRTVTVNNGVIDRYDAYEKLCAWLVELMEDASIG